MTDQVGPPENIQANDDAKRHERAALEGEPGIPDVGQPPRVQVSRKAVVTVALLVLSLIAVSAISIQRLIGAKKSEDADSKRVSDRPAAASTEPKRLDLALPAASPTSAAPAAYRVPAIVPSDDEAAEPIAVRRTAPPTARDVKPALPEDAPAVLVSSRPMAAVSARGGTTGDAADASTAGTPLEQTRRTLEMYQRQLQGMLDTAARPSQGLAGTPAAPVGGPLQSGPPTAPNVNPSAPSSGGLFGGQLQGSATAVVTAGNLGNRSLVLPKGTAFTCALKTKVVSATSGFVGCQVQRNVFSDDGRVLLIERGSHMDGEYRIASVRPGTVRIPVLWTRIRTPNGVVVNIDSPGTGALGESGIEGYVDNRWPERIGAALLLSVIDDAVKLAIAHQTEGAQGSGTVVLQSTTDNASKLAEKVLDSTINIPPLIYHNQGGVVGIYVARDVDFSSVYELQAVPR
jgi:type IV secretion system protein VirB10